MIRSRKLISILLASALITFIIPTEARAASTVDDFVDRCYYVALGRKADEGGFNFWKGQLTDGKICGSATVSNFIFSNEYLSKNASDKDFVTDCYTMFMGRTPDNEGYNFWCGELSKGMTRESLFAGFANSDEFYNMCSDSGITAGYYDMNYPLGQVNNVNLFVERLYKTCLGRIGDKGGQTYWTQGLLSGELTGTSCASCYILSDEFTNKGLSNSDFIKSLYLAFMDREYDEGGLNYWLSLMDNGATKEQIFAGFANSDEFAAICASYGIDRGTYIPPEVTPTPEPTNQPEPTATPVPTATPAPVPTSHYDFDASVLNATSANYLYLVNTNTCVYHKPGCRAIKKMSDDNKGYSNCSSGELGNAGLRACGICKP